MFTKIGVTAASAAMPALLWAGAAGAQDSQSSLTERCQSQSQSQVQSPECTVPPTVNTTPQTTGSGSLARTGAEDMLPLAVGGAALAGAVVVRRGLRRRSAA